MRTIACPVAGSGTRRPYQLFKLQAKAAITDSEAALPAPTGLPLFHLDDVDRVAAFILAQAERCRYQPGQ